MKLVIAVVNRDDTKNVVENLTKHGFSSTKLSSSGGFLSAGNITLLVGVRDEQVQRVIDLIRDCSHSRKEMISTASGEMALTSMPTLPVEVTVGGATVFVVDVERFERL